MPIAKAQAEALASTLLQQFRAGQITEEEWHNKVGDILLEYARSEEAAK